MLGAGVAARDPTQEHPMEDWQLWWLLRTYFQSLGQASSIRAPDAGE